MVFIRRLCLAAACAWVVLPGRGAAGAATAPATSTAPTTTTAPVPLPALDPNSFRAFDRPSDNGSAIIVEWARPKDEPKGLSYVLEIARSKEAFAKGDFKTIPVRAALKSSNPKYFGIFSKANRSLYFAQVTPAEHYPPPKAEKLTPARVAKLRDAGRLNERQAKRAILALQAATQPAQLTASQKADRKWLARFGAFLSTTDDDERKDRQEAINAETYSFRLAVTDGTRKAYVARGGKPVIVSAAAGADWFKQFRLNNLLFALTFTAIVMLFIHAARRNPNLFIRKIPGLEAVDEAIGRATEMGRSVFFVHGLAGMGDLATIAAVNVLARVARRAAEYDTRVRVMNYEPIVTAVSQEVVQQAYTEAGRPDAFDPDDVSLVATRQFSYVAAVSGLLVREQPAAVFLMGKFYAESLLLAETGASTGAIQIAGTDSYTQLPFFITTCDYTLIGEELYAASAYLSREPRMLGSLRGQDVGKAFLMAVILIGSVLLSLGSVLSRAGIDVNLLRGLFRAF